MSEKALKTTESNFAVQINDIMNGKSHLSYSAISKFLKSPRHFKEYKTGKFEKTPAMEEGSMFHMACLEPDKFKDKYWVLDDAEKCNEIGGAKPRATKEYKEWVLIQDSKNEGKTRISSELFDTFMSMSKALTLNSATKNLMASLTSKEESLEFEHDGFLIKGAIDGVGENEEWGGYILDLKKVADASFKKIKWDIFEMNYDMQAAIYAHAKGLKHCFLIYIDKSCNITVVKLTSGTLETGFNKFEGALSSFEQCAQEDLWDSSYEFHNGGLINV